jgi:leader peptidase (prepilin peptidase) / N-methyltransferase
VSGTLIGLLAAAGWPFSLLPDIVFLMPGQLPGPGFLQLASPNPWPASLNGMPHVGSLVLGLACWWMWCVAILPRTWYARHGSCRAIKLSAARVMREPSSYRILRMAVIGTLAIALVWYRNDYGWWGLLSALVGMAVGGGLIWSVRIIGAVTLGREAMGFGDVTLMAMIGAFLGWQASLLIFFLAPIAGLVLGVLRMILFRDREIPYGPFLCLASLFVIVQWDALWENTQILFELGWLVPAVMLVCLVLMGVMLAAWRAICSLFG